MRPLSRRTLFKSSAVAAATTGVVVGASQLKAGANEVPSGLGATQVPSVCEMCTSRCPMVAHVNDGKVTLITGNPDFAGTGGTVCARGGAGLSLTYDDQRVRKPLIRDGERGSGKWREVSYDEAIAYIVEKMAKIRDEDGPEAMAFACRAGIHTEHLFTFAKAYGSPNTFTHESTCPGARTVAYQHVAGRGMSPDYGNTKYLVSFGRNYLEGLHVPQVRGVLSAMGKGARLVYIDPRYGLTASKATEWLPIRPGTDLAMVQALNHVLIRDGLYNKAFVEKYTTGFEEYADSIKDLTPEWAEAETDIPAATIERIATELAAKAPNVLVDPGWRTCYSTDEFSLRRALIFSNMLLGSIEVPGGLYLAKSAGVVNGIVGSPVIPVVGKPAIPKLPDLPPRIDGVGVEGAPYQFGSPADGVVQEVPEAILSGKPYPVKGWFVYRYNPVLTMNNTARVLEAINKLDLLVVCDVAVTDTGYYADVVLPEASYLERTEHIMDSSGAAPAYKLRQAAVEPLEPDYRPNWQIIKDLADGLGVSDYFPWADMDEYLATSTKDNPELLTTLKEKGVASFGMKPLYLRDKASVATFVAQFPEAAAKVDADGELPGPLLNLTTASKKLEFVSPRAAKLGHGVPAASTSIDLKPGQLYFVQGKTSIHTNGHTHNVPMLYDLMPVNTLWIHPETAAGLGVGQGDKVRLSNDTGEAEGVATVTELVRPDTVFCYYGFGRISPELKRAYKQGINSNQVMPSVAGNVCGAVLQNTGVTVSKI